MGGALLGPGVDGDVRLGQDEDGADALGLEAVVDGGHRRERRGVGDPAQGPLNGLQIVQDVALSPAEPETYGADLSEVPETGALICAT